jgi:4-aminobutyrate aminotransferase-like enzyme/Ser/Thr protein kinase RdoA (MazF antagonist)
MSNPYYFIDPKYAEELAYKHFGLDSKAKKLPGEMAENFLISTKSGNCYTLKIAHPQEPLSHLEMQNAMMRHLNKGSFGLTLPMIVPARSGSEIISLEVFNVQRYVRLLTWIPGRVWADVNPKSPELLESLGNACGNLCKGLSGFNHPGAHIWHKWDLAQASWIADKIQLITDPEKRDLVNYFFGLFTEKVLPRIPSLRKGIIYNDANDRNVIVSQDSFNPKVAGVIDFGDSVYTCQVFEVAIAAAYAIMDKQVPLDAAATLVKGFHAAFPLTEVEIELIYPLIATRLLLTVIIGTINAQESPNNDYLMVSQHQAWDLLKKWRLIHFNFAYYTFRKACGLEPYPNRCIYEKWFSENPHAIQVPVNLKGRAVTPFDLSVGSLDLGNTSNYLEIRQFSKTINKLLEEQNAEIGAGGYGEIRPFYTSDAFTEPGNRGPRWRTVHLGIDIWSEAETEVICPLNGNVHSLRLNEGERNYGPTIILEHRISEELTFYTLYGHLSLDSIQKLKVGQFLRKGEVFAKTGAAPANGNWPPHLHFQLILDLMSWVGDYPGVAFPEEAAIWLSLCPNPAMGWGWNLSKNNHVPLSSEHIAEQRRKCLGKSLSLSYQKPLHIVRGYMQFLYNHTGQRFLDTVNNVAHVGHENPQVIKALTRQAALLNTNTRYLHAQITSFAEELLATFPPQLSVVHFVNSGSEANELALRMAKSYTGGKDFIVLQSGYHGNTNACVGISSYKFDGKGGKGAPPSTHVVPMPDTYRGQCRDKDKAGKFYGSFVHDSIEQIKVQGRNPAGFIAESILSCGGQIVLPNGYLSEAYGYVRKAGGVCIADEVQVGFGRVGDVFWGFELQEVVPDIVTMGKPVGNGHPLGAVVCTREIAEAFANGMEYFNTFGGNPVSCAVGREVLRIIKEEGLQKKAQKTGGLLVEMFKELQSKHAIIGDVRGYGLFLGIELVKNKTMRTPATMEAAYLANRMREYGILISTDGPFENVIKIKPPMCFNEQDAHFMRDALDQVLKEDAIWKGLC